MSVTATRVAMVRPPRAHVATAIADLRAAPDDASELVDQAHAGEAFALLGEEGGWAYVQGEDLYFGWIRSQDLRADPPSRRVVVALNGAPLRREPDERAEVIGAVDAGVRCDEPRAGWARCAAGWVAVSDTVALDRLPRRYPTADDLIATAESFLGVPYLWGGTGARGLDCSGLTQRVYRLNGVGLDRDADQQALGGRPVDRAQPGDLLFFGAERVTHVAIATGERAFIHAPQRGAVVERGLLSAARPLRGVRRYLR